MLHYRAVTCFWPKTYMHLELNLLETVNAVNLGNRKESQTASIRFFSSSYVVLEQVHC